MTNPPNETPAAPQVVTRRRVTTWLRRLFRLVTPPKNTRRRVTTLGLATLLLGGLLLATAPFIPDASAQTGPINKAGCVAEASNEATNVITQDSDEAEQLRRVAILENRQNNFVRRLIYDDETDEEKALIWFFDRTRPILQMDVRL